MFSYFFECLKMFDGMPDIGNFTLLGAVYFCIPMSIFELCSLDAAKLPGNSVILFALCFYLRLVRWDQSNILSRSSYSPLMKQDSSENSTQCLMNHEA